VELRAEVNRQEFTGNLGVPNRATELLFDPEEFIRGDGGK